MACLPHSFQHADSDSVPEREDLNVGVRIIAGKVNANMGVEGDFMVRVVIYFAFS